MLWRIRQNITTRMYWLLALAGLIAPLFAWYLLAVSGAVNPIFLPSPQQVLSRIFRWLMDGDLLGDVGISTGRVVAGWALSAVIALPLGLCIGSWRAMQALL